MEAFGDALVVEPYLATVMTAQFVARGGTPAQRASILGDVAAGKRVLAFAQTEAGARYNLAEVSTRARAAGGGYVIDGEKSAVIHGPCADLLVVSARTAGHGADPSGISLFVVDPRAPGVTTAQRENPRWSADRRRIACRCERGRGCPRRDPRARHCR